MLPIHLRQVSFVERLAEIANEAGEAAMRFYGRGGDADEKADGSPVTAADRAAHNVILEALSQLDSSIPVISEEAAAPPYEERKEWRRFWLVDPLDGTKEFLAVNGEFTINIALIEDGEPVFGVVTAPAVRTSFLAGRDVGAWKRVDGGQTVRLATVPWENSPLRIVESRSHPSPQLEAFIAALGPVERTRLGSSLKFCRVAEGAADLYPRFGRTMEWDVAAGDCIFRNSGANGYTPQSPLVYNQPSLSSNEFVIGEVRRR